MSGFFKQTPFPDQRPLTRPEPEKVARRDPTRGRGWIVAMGFAVAFALLGYRMGALALAPPADERPRNAATKTPERGQILDRHGRVLASTLPTWEVALRPRKTAAAGGLSPDDLTALKRIFPDLDQNRLRFLVNEGKASFTYIERRASPRQWREARDLGIIGMEAIQRSDRVFPPGRVAGHVLGGVDIDNKGVAGIEKEMEERLTLGPDGAEEIAPLTLSLDMRVQNALHLTMSEAVAEFAALGAAGLVMDVRSGELLAMVSLPDFDPNSRPPLPKPGSDPALSPLFNRVTQGIYELGSVFKLVTVAAALDAEVVDIDTRVDASRPIRRGGFTISDYLGKNRVMTVEEVIRFSSNIGSVRIAELLGVPRHKAFLGLLGMDTRVPLELPAPERSAGQLPGKWRSVNAATVSYGHGLAVTPLHIAAGIASIANYGCKVTPTLLRRSAPPPCERVVSREVSGKMRALMRVVGKHSSGRSANIAGYEIGGKTGTAYKVKPTGGYDLDKRFNTFIALWPTTEPQYLLLLSLDDPKLLDGSSRLPLAGRTSAPAAGRAIERIAALLGQAPTDRFRPTGQFVDEVTEGGALPISLPPLEGEQ